jgi:hypothetical protein
MHYLRLIRSPCGVSFHRVKRSDVWGRPLFLNGHDTLVHRSGTDALVAPKILFVAFCPSVFFSRSAETGTVSAFHFTLGTEASDRDAGRSSLVRVLVRA